MVCFFGINNSIIISDKEKDVTLKSYIFVKIYLKSEVK